MAIYNFGPWETKRLPALDSNSPADASVSVTETATFSVVIAEEGKPENYTYQRYKNGEAVEGATESSYSFSQATEGTATVYCEVTNKAGTVKSRTATFTANKLYLYNYGDICEAASGGWVEALTSSSPMTDLALNADHIAISGRTNQYDGGCGTANLIDLSKHTRLSAMAYTSDPSGRSCMFVCSQLNSFDTNALAVVGVSTTAQVISLDISNIDSGYIAFSAHGGEAPHSTVIHSVWLG